MLVAILLGTSLLLANPAPAETQESVPPAVESLEESESPQLAALGSGLCSGLPLVACEAVSLVALVYGTFFTVWLGWCCLIVGNIWAFYAAIYTCILVGPPACVVFPASWGNTVFSALWAASSFLGGLVSSAATWAGNVLAQRRTPLLRILAVGMLTSLAGWVLAAGVTLWGHTMGLGVGAVAGYYWLATVDELQQVPGSASRVYVAGSRMLLATGMAFLVFAGVSVAGIVLHLAGQATTAAMLAATSTFHGRKRALGEDFLHLDIWSVPDPDPRVREKELARRRAKAVGPPKQDPQERPLAPRDKKDNRFTPPPKGNEAGCLLDNRICYSAFGTPLHPVMQDKLVVLYLVSLLPFGTLWAIPIVLGSDAPGVTPELVLTLGFWEVAKYVVQVVPYVGYAAYFGIHFYLGPVNAIRAWNRALWEEERKKNRAPAAPAPSPRQEEEGGQGEQEGEEEEEEDEEQFDEDTELQGPMSPA